MFEVSWTFSLTDSRDIISNWTRNRLLLHDGAEQMETVFMNIIHCLDRNTDFGCIKRKGGKKKDIIIYKQP